MNIKELIADTFEKELAKRDGDKITVKDIVDTCGISRQTFYYHFQDLQEVLEWTFIKKMECVLEYSSKQDEIWKVIKILLDEIWANRKYTNRLRKSKNMDKIQSMLIDVISRYIRQMIESKADYVVLSTKELNLLIEYNACAITTIMIRKSEDKEFDTEKYAKFIEKTISGKINLFEFN